MIASFLAGCLIAGSIGVGLLMAACALVRLWPASDSRGERVSELLLAIAGLGVAVVQGLGFAGVLGTRNVVLAAVSCGVFGFASRRARERAAMLLADIRAGVSATQSSLPLAAASALGLLLACRGLWLPELSWDGLTYHLTYPAAWLQTGSFDRFEAGGVWEQYESFPKAGEALFFLAIVPFHADHFVHWVNPVLWLGIAIAVRAAALRLGVRRLAADASAVLAIACPALSAYVTPAYVEVPMTFALCVALTAALRALIAKDAGALAPMWLGLGLGAAIKMTALAYLPLGLLVTLFTLRALTPRQCARSAGWGLLLAAVVALPWYLHNLVHCGNPLYPAGLPGASDGPGAGTLANVWAVRESSVLSQAAVLDVLDHLAKPPWKVRYPLGPGWLFLGALPLCLALSFWVWLRARAKAPAILAGLAVALSVLYAVSPWNGVFREANTRFLAPALIAAVLSCAASSSQLQAWLGRLLAALGGSVLLVALGSARFVRDGVGSASAALAVVMCVGAVLTWLHATAVARERRLRWLLGAVFTASLACASLTYAVHVREGRRHAAFANDVDLHPGARSPELWRFVDSLPPSRIAFSVGDVNATEGWFFYPLFGSRLQHRVSYVDIEATDSAACLRRGLIRDQPDREAWRNRLLENRFNYLAIQGRSLELGWAQSDPKLFRRVFSAMNATVYAIDPPVLTGHE
ncbi:MAG TPA: hypothetical protein VFG30_03700 [Polyangiales bacterium]|nr:hypothetical protein [Polyangiales bacterium]